jgi:hypothetical protein
VPWFFLPLAEGLDCRGVLFGEADGDAGVGTPLGLHGVLEEFRGSSEHVCVDADKLLASAYIDELARETMMGG